MLFYKIVYIFSEGPRAFKNNSPNSSMNEMGWYGALFSGAAFAGAGVMILKKAYKDYASDREWYDSILSQFAEDPCVYNEAGAIPRPSYAGSLKRELLRWKGALMEEVGKS
jgi:hypothetical protein